MSLPTLSEIPESTPAETVFGPQPGPQSEFAATPADVAVFGGQAGGGKSFWLVMEPLRHCHRARFGAVFFRQTYNQIMEVGGLWDEASGIYPHYGGRSLISKSRWIFPSGAKVRFAHMDRDETLHKDWDGAQIPLICFDQLEHFTWKQFFYLFSRNRTTCGIRPYIRATCNPRRDHWLRDFMDWWIDNREIEEIPAEYIEECKKQGRHCGPGFPRWDRSGIIRYFCVIKNVVHWADTRQELLDEFGEDTEPKTFTFIPSQLTDNKKLIEADPGYSANLRALPEVDQQRLGQGNWNAVEQAGTIFKRIWFEIVDPSEVPPMTDEIRYWDRAATETEPGKEDEASWTAGVRMGIDARECCWITDVVKFQLTPGAVEDAVKNTATQDGRKIRVGIEEDPGQAGVSESRKYIKLLKGYAVTLNPVGQSKLVRARPLSAYAFHGLVKIVRAPWNEAFLDELVKFDGTKTCQSDQTDSASGAFYKLTNRKSVGVWGRR